MNKIFTGIAIGLLTFSSWQINAAPKDEAPPAQLQKDKVPNSTSNGNYLEPQPDENGAATNNASKSNKGVKPGNIEKSKKVTEPPEKGGTKVN